MKTPALFALILCSAACDNPFDQTHQDCAKARANDFKTAVSNRNNLTSFGQFKNTMVSGWNGLKSCWFHGVVLPTDQPEVEPTEVAFADLPPGAMVADWIDRPGFIVYYVDKTDGSGYNYFKVRNPAAVPVGVE